MTTDRRRVDAACAAYYGDDWLEDGAGPSQARRVAMSRALAAADAIAPPLPEEVRDLTAEEASSLTTALLRSGRERVRVSATPAELADTDKIEAAGLYLFPEWDDLPTNLRTGARDRLGHIMAWGGRLARAERRVKELEEALLPAAPLAVPADVLRAYHAHQDAFDDITGVVTAENNKRMNEATRAFASVCLSWVRTLLATPVPPAVPENVRDLTAEGASSHDALLGQMTRALTTAEQWQERAMAAEQCIAELEAERDEARRGDYTALEVGGYARRAQIAEEEADAAEKRRDEACEAAVIHMQHRYHAEARLKVATRNALEMAAQLVIEVVEKMDAGGHRATAQAVRPLADKIRALSDTDPAGRATELEAEQDAARILDQNAIRLLRERAEAAEARLARAREALEEIANECDPDDPEWHFPAQARKHLWDVSQEAIRALADTDPAGRADYEARLARAREALTKVRDRFFPTWQPERDRDVLWNEVNAALSDTSPDAQETQI